MKTTIYYFSGTGNSLYTARRLKEGIDDCQIIPIVHILKQERIESVSENIGFVFPIYYMGIPRIVKEFVEKINLNSAKYIFTVVTVGNPISGGAIKQLNKLLVKKNLKLNTGLYIYTVNNYLPMYEMPEESQIEKKMNDFNKKIDKAKECIIAKKNIKREGFLVIATPFVNPKFINDVNTKDKDFYVEDSCNSCGLCEKICPVDNISLVDGKPNWNHKCEQCFACIHYCPKQAIQFGKKSKQRGRYHHPEVSADDIMKQK